MRDPSIEKRIDLQSRFPVMLAEHCEQNVREIRRCLFSGRGGDYTGRSHESGADQIEIDQRMNQRDRSFILEKTDCVRDEWGARLILTGEEERGGTFVAATGNPPPWEPDDVVVITDSPDGSTNAKSYGEGYSSVAVAFQRIKDDWQHIGGAIAASNGFTVSWSGLGWVFARPSDGESQWRQIRRARGRRSVSASVATRVSRYRGFRRNLDSTTELANVLAGTPCIFPLLVLDLGVVIEPRPQKPYDAAHIIPAMMAGCSVTNLGDRVPWTLDDAVGFFVEYLEHFHNEPEKLIVPPFRIDSEPVRTVLKDVVREKPPETERNDDERLSH